ncbi:MAG: ABC transporter ATP-binding protein/permease [Clostridiales bacterium]|jgi:ATP-binding cassette subfamily B protein|nr:ABC transporter ATP-binding protein/permease [Clostridiales bacterium]
MKSVKFIWFWLRGSRLLYVLALLCVLVSAALSLLTPYLIKIIVDFILGAEFGDAPRAVAAVVNAVGGRDFLRAHLWICGLAIVCTTLLNGLIMFNHGVLCAKAAERAIKRLRDELYSHIQRLPYADLVRIHTGDYIQRCTSDVDLIGRFMETQFVEAGRTLILIIGILSVMFTQSVRFTLVSLPIVPLVFIFSIVFFHLVRDKFKKTDESEGRMMTVLQENLTGVKVVRAFARQRFEIDKFEASSAEFRDLDIGLANLVSWFWAASDFLCWLQTGAVVVAGTLWAVQGVVTLGTVLLFISYEAQLLWPVRQLARIFSDLGRMSISIKRLREILETPAEDMRAGGAKPWITGDVVFEHVGFSYATESGVNTESGARAKEGAAAGEDAASPVSSSPSPSRAPAAATLTDISFTVRRGQTVAIMGPTGSGKTTLVQLIAALYDYTSGSIRLDGAELRGIDKEWLRAHVGIVEQEVFLFSRTIEENIAIAREAGGYTQDEVYKAARLAEVHHVVEEFREGYQTVVGERGVTLSGGQKQRVAIARTILGDYPILIFDDSLSAVDTETDAAIRRALKERSRDVTTFIIAHRITTLYDADLILVVEKGRISQQGTHEELIRRPGLYKRIWDLQSDVQ